MRVLSEKDITIPPRMEITSLERRDAPSGEVGRLHQVIFLMEFYLQDEEVAENKEVCLPVMITNFLQKTIQIQP